MENEVWENQMVLTPVGQLLHWQRSEVERREWAARNAEQAKDNERLRAENASLRAENERLRGWNDDSDGLTAWAGV